MAAVLVLLTAASCGGDSAPSTPTQPSRASAAVTVGTFSVTATETASLVRYSVTLSAREVSGQTAATLGNAVFEMFRGSDGLGGVTLDNAWPTQRLPAGGTVSARAITITDDRDGRVMADRVRVRVSYFDEIGNTGDFVATVDLAAVGPPPAPVAFTLFGVISDFERRTALGGVRVQVVDGSNAGRSTVTDGNGYYSLPGLQGASFTLRATLDGYAVSDTGLNLSADRRLDFTMLALGSTDGGDGGGGGGGTGGIGTCGPSGPGPSCSSATAVCSDGTRSCSRNRSGTCSSHNGVRCWVCPGPLC